MSLVQLMYFVYIILDEQSGQFSVGMTADLDRHLRSIPGYPGQIRVYSEALQTRSEAKQREAMISAWDHQTMLKALEQ